jgi:histidinol phosphatase-like PHP family hydrolase
MIDLHTHSLLSDGVLLPSELSRRYEAAGFEAVAITDHVDASNIDVVLPHIIKACNDLNGKLKIKLIPGIELTHVPVQGLSRLVKFARRAGAKLIVVHGETLVEPVAPGTNRKALELDIDILAHPGLISLQEARLAAKRGIYLEISLRKGHCLSNGYVAKIAKEAEAKLVINSDSHSPQDIPAPQFFKQAGLAAGLSETELSQALKNSQLLAKRCS